MIQNSLKILLIYILTTKQIAFSQSNQIQLEFKEPNNTIFTRTLDSVGNNHHELELLAIKDDKDSINSDCKIYIKIEHFNTTNKDITLIDTIIFIPKESFYRADTVFTKINLSSKNDTLKFPKGFKVYTETSSSFVDCSVSIILETKKTNDIAISFQEKASDDIGRLFLVQNMNIPVYHKKKFGQRKCLRSCVRCKNKEHKIDGFTKRFLRRYNKDSSNQVSIEWVRVIIENGQIISIIAKTQGECDYYKNKGPISLTNFDEKKNYPLEYSGPTDEYRNTYISLKDFLDYIPSTGRFYYPSQTDFILDSTSTYEELQLIGSPNSYFDARAYTDTKGLSGEQNGLVQTEINAQFISNSNNIGRSYLSFFKYVRLGVAWSKFDSQFDTLNVNSFMNRNDSDLLNYLRQSNTSFNIETDFLHGSRVCDVYITLGHRIYHTPMVSQDSVPIFRRTFTPTWHLTLGTTIFATPQISAKLIFPIYAAYVHDQPFLNYTRRWNLFISPEIEISVRLRKPEANDEKKRSFVFARIKYFDMPMVSQNNFWQIQTGIEIPLSNLFDN